MNVRYIWLRVLAIPSVIPLFCMEQTCRELQYEIDVLVDQQNELLMWKERKLQRDRYITEWGNGR